MKLTIKIDLDNDAFRDALGFEVARILAELVADFQGGALELTGPAVGPNLYDVNGNICGFITVTR